MSIKMTIFTLFLQKKSSKKFGNFSPKNYRAIQENFKSLKNAQIPTCLTDRQNTLRTHLSCQHQFDIDTHIVGFDGIRRRDERCSALVVVEELQIDFLREDIVG